MHPYTSCRFPQAPTFYNPIGKRLLRRLQRRMNDEIQLKAEGNYMKKIFIIGISALEQNF
jgi:hypothetical protein